MDEPSAPSETELRCQNCGPVAISTSHLTIIDPNIGQDELMAGVDFSCPRCERTQFQPLGRPERAALLAAGAQISIGESPKVSGTARDHDRPEFS